MNPSFPGQVDTGGDFSDQNLLRYSITEGTKKKDSQRARKTIFKLEKGGSWQKTG